MTDKPTGAKPNFQLVAPPSTEGGFWNEVGVAWEKTDANGNTYYSIVIPLLGQNFILRERKTFEKDADAPANGAKFKARKPRKVTEDEIDF